MFFLKDESGMAMIIAVVVILLGSILAGSHMSIVMHESKHAVWQKHRAQALYLAEAGLEKSLYYINSIDDPDNPWVDNTGEMVPAPLYLDPDEPSNELAGLYRLSEGKYKVEVYDQTNMAFIPEGSYLIRSTGIIPRSNSKDIEHRVSCIASRLEEPEIPGALAIMDDADLTPELVKFDSNMWTISGKDMDDPLGQAGLPGIAVANFGDDVAAQLGARVDSVTGSEQDPVTGDWIDTVGVGAIMEDPAIFEDLGSYTSYFQRIAIDVSSPTGSLYTLPSSVLGSKAEPQVLYADLSKGSIKLAGTTKAYGILVLEGDPAGLNEFEMAGGSEWNGIVVCTGTSVVRLKGGGGSPSHIYGALLVSDGFVEMNGTADIVYSSENVKDAFAALLLYQVYSWCGGWGNAL